MNVNNILEDLSNSNAEHRVVAQRAIASFEPNQIEEVLNIAKRKTQTRKHWLNTINICLTLYSFLSLYWTYTGFSGWPAWAKVFCVLLWLILFPVGLLLSLGGLGENYRYVIRAFTFMDTNDLRVAGYLIDALHYDWRVEFPNIVQAIGRILSISRREESEQFLTEVHRRRLWWAVSSASRSRNLTVEQAKSVESILTVLIFPDEKKRLMWLLKHLKEKDSTDGQQYLLTVVKNALSANLAQ